MPYGMRHGALSTLVCRRLIFAVIFVHRTDRRLHSGDAVPSVQWAAARRQSPTSPPNLRAPDIRSRISPILRCRALSWRGMPQSPFAFTQGRLNSADVVVVANEAIGVPLRDMGVRKPLVLVGPSRRRSAANRGAGIFARAQGLVRLCIRQPMAAGRILPHLLAAARTARA